MLFQQRSNLLWQLSSPGSSLAVQYLQYRRQRDIAKGTKVYNDSGISFADRIDE